MKKIVYAPKALWDYQITHTWTPKNKKEWLWYLERKINYDDWQGLEAKIIKKFFPLLKRHLDPGKRKLLEYYFKIYG